MLYNVYYVYVIEIPTHIYMYVCMCVLDLTLVIFSCNIKAKQLLRPFSNRQLPSLTKSYGRAGLQ